MHIPDEDNQFSGSNIPNGHYEQIDQLTWDIQAMIHRYKKEWDLPLESIVGVLEFVKTEITAGDYDIFLDAGDDDPSVG